MAADPSASRESKQVSTTFASDTSSSQGSIKEIPEHGSYEGHVFSDSATAQHWRDVFEHAQYEGRHRFDPDYTWTAEEEKKLVRKVCASP